jgi:hypothetical protein
MVTSQTSRHRFEGRVLYIAGQDVDIGTVRLNCLRHRYWKSLSALVQRAYHDCVQAIAIMSEITECGVPLRARRELIGALDEQPELLN